MTQVPRPASKDGNHILHLGVHDENTAAEYAHPPKKVFWPRIWKTGSVVYDAEDESKCIRHRTNVYDSSLRFNARFESGNLRCVYRLAGDAYHVILEKDSDASRSCQWFYFQVTNTRALTPYTFYISGFSKKTSVFGSGSRVFMYSEHSAKTNERGWVRAGSHYGYGVTRKRRDRTCVSLQFSVIFPYDKDTVYLAYAIPYTYTDLRRHISVWHSRARLLVDVSTISRTTGGRDCPLLTVTSPTLGRKTAIVMTGRVHPGESNGSIVLHGVIDFLLSHHHAAQFLRDNHVIYIVPMINVDGVVEGTTRTDLGGYDLNRVWTNPDPVMHPVVFETKKLIERLSNECTVAAYIDFHGHARLHGTFAYGCPNKGDPALADVEKQLPKIMTNLSDGFSWKQCVFSYPKARTDASRVVLRRELGIVHSITIETSFGGTLGPRASKVLYDEYMWKSIGANIGESMYYLMSGKQPPVRELSSEKPSTSRPPLSSRRTVVVPNVSRNQQCPRYRGNVQSNQGK